MRTLRTLKIFLLEQLPIAWRVSRELADKQSPDPAPELDPLDLIPRRRSPRRPGPRPKQPSEAALTAWKMWTGGEDIPLREIAERLNCAGHRTATGKKWNEGRVYAQLQQVKRWREHRASLDTNPKEETRDKESVA